MVEITEKLLKNEESYLLQQMPVALYVTDQNGVLIFYNQKAVELWGRSPRLNDPKEKRFCGSYMMFNLDGTPLPHSQSPTAIALQQQQTILGEEIIIERPEGSQVIALVNISPLFKNNGFTGTLTIMQDITLQKKNEQAIWHLAAIINSSDDAIISKTLTGLITSWNPAAEKILGYTEEEMLGQPITTIIPVSLRKEEEMILKHLRRGEKIDHFETTRVTKDGTHIPVSITVSPVKNRQGKIIGASKILRKKGGTAE